MPSLHDVLFCAHTQRGIIEKGAFTLNILKTHAVPGSLCGSDNSETLPSPGNVSINASTLLRTLTCKQESVGGDRVAGYYQQLARVEQSSVVLTFAVLSMLALFPGACREIAAGTPANLVPFLVGAPGLPDISARFERYITGGDGAAAKLPSEMVVAELLLYHRMCH